MGRFYRKLTPARARNWPLEYRKLLAEELTAEFAENAEKNITTEGTEDHRGPCLPQRLWFIVFSAFFANSAVKRFYRPFTPTAWFL